MYLMLYNSNFYFIFSKQKQIISNRFNANQLLNSLKISHQQKLLLYLNLQQNVLNFINRYKVAVGRNPFGISRNVETSLSDVSTDDETFRHWRNVKTMQNV